ncbi:MAG TPA: uroporphyrinogen-III C-methyltransferase [Myxococcota bacterium]|nr:uroporphyrinogen-III C-methyltransferase [Myxococcota bacterium]
MSGVVYLVGAGPGAADLLTLRAARVLSRADVVFHDALVHPEVVALAQRAQIVAVGKRCGAHSTAQRFIHKRLIDAARKHAVVVRLKGGDPLLFGRAQEELDALREAGIACEIVPGVSAAFAASAALGISLTERGVARSVCFATPRSGADHAAGDWVASVLAADTAALYMASEHAAEIARTLITRGKPPETPVVIVESATLAVQREHAATLAELAADPPQLTGGPALLLIGPPYRRALAARVSALQRSAHASSK